MLQNRVDPFGAIIKTSARGSWMGNRGLVHNDKQQIVRPYRLIPWITCVLEFKGRRRKVMTPGLYTELFFLDEATAFSAGHRPCKECRREDHLTFKNCWIQGNPQYQLTDRSRIGEIDKIIHAERITADGKKITHEEDLDTLPDGVFIVLHQQPFLVKADKLYPWDPEGYGPPIDRPKGQQAIVLTPASIVNAFRAGYTPQIGV